MKKLIFVFLLSAGIFSINAQEVVKNIIVEHFTNTRCGICSSRNPGFYTALQSKPNVKHIAFHPSSPYNNCLFSTQNKSENDARTNYYGIYGSTPRFMINGKEKSGTEVANNNVYTEFENKKSPIDVQVKLFNTTNDSIIVTVKITTVATHNLANTTLFVGLAEDTVLYNAPNGEKTHHDVFRKSFTGNNAIPITISGQVGSVYNFTSKVKKNALWTLPMIYGFAIVNTSSKEVAQSGFSPRFDPLVLSSNEEVIVEYGLKSYPNPFVDMFAVEIDNFQSVKSLKVFDASGKILVQKTNVAKRNNIDSSSWGFGVYYLLLETVDNRKLSSTLLKK